ncbi:uncharacterized protein LOC117315537 [Pecten maximus]|uniref:uncharacterized protein LOC117315537 n=1 Tax=Pecten maximus TaxID=6579 RepID=UPI0014583C13|nr:uncharacterized protein LOC117315537 [Pecten maximus]
MAAVLLLLLSLVLEVEGCINTPLLYACNVNRDDTTLDVFYCTMNEEWLARGVNTTFTLCCGPAPPDQPYIIITHWQAGDRLLGECIHYFPHIKIYPQVDCDMVEGLVDNCIHEETPTTVHEETPTTVHEETPTMVHEETSTTVHEETSTTVHEETPTTVHEETSTTVHEETSTTVHEETPTTVHEETSTTVHEETPTTVHEETPTTVHEETLTTVHEETPTTVHEETPTTVHEETSTTVHEETSTTVHEETPTTVHEETSTTVHEETSTTTAVKVLLVLAVLLPLMFILVFLLIRRRAYRGHKPYRMREEGDIFSIEDQSDTIEMNRLDPPPSDHYEDSDETIPKMVESSIDVSQIDLPPSSSSSSTDTHTVVEVEPIWLRSGRRKH